MFCLFSGMRIVAVCNASCLSGTAGFLIVAMFPDTASLLRGHTAFLTTCLSLFAH